MFLLQNCIWATGIEDVVLHELLVFEGNILYNIPPGPPNKFYYYPFTFNEKMSREYVIIYASICVLVF